MPHRSNFFQRLIYLTRVNLGEGAEVFESKMLKDRITGQFREVDIVIRGRVGSEVVIVSIECRDHKRSADVTWIDAMKSKHERLDTNVLMLASANGFSAGAKALAEKYNIQLVSLTLGDETDSLNIPQLSELQTDRTTTLHCEGLYAIVSGLPNPVPLLPSRQLYNSSGASIGKANEIPTSILGDEVALNEIHAQVASEGYFSFVAELITTWEDITEEYQLFIKILPSDDLHLVEALKMKGIGQLEIKRFAMRSGKIGSTNVHWGQVEVKGLKCLAVVTLSSSGNPKVIFSAPGAVEPSPVLELVPDKVDRAAVSGNRT